MEKCTDCGDYPVCDFCCYYDFNANEEGAYTSDGKCEHPDHLGDREPWDICDDFKCFML